MEVKVEALDGNKVKAIVTVDADSIESITKGVYRDFSNRRSYPGFRKGKVPRKVIDSMLGVEYVMATVTESVVNDHYPLVVEEQGLHPIGQPDFDNADLVEPGKGYTFSFTVEVKPEFELTSYEPLEIELPCAAVTDADVDQQIEAMLEHYTSFEDANAATKLKAENAADIAIVVTDESGEHVESLEGDSRTFRPGSGMYPEAFDAEVLGMKKGQTKEFSIEVPEGDESLLFAGMGGKKLNFEVTCNVVKKAAKPNLTDEWVSENMSFDSIDAFKQALSDSLQQQKNAMLPRLKEDACMSALLERFDGTAPDPMVEESESSLLQDFFTQLQQQSVSFDSYLMQQNLTPEQFKADVRKQASDMVRERLALDAWARHHGIVATPEDVTAEFVGAGLDDPAGAEEEWRKTGRLHLIREGIIRAKAMDDVTGKAVVTEVDYAAESQKDSKKKPAKKAAKKA